MNELLKPALINGIRPWNEYKSDVTSRDLTSRLASWRIKSTCGSIHGEYTVSNPRDNNDHLIRIVLVFCFSFFVFYCFVF